MDNTIFALPHSDALVDPFTRSHEGDGTVATQKTELVDRRFTQPRVGRLIVAAAFRLRNRCVLAAMAVGGGILLLTRHPVLATGLVGAGAVTYAGLVIRDLFDTQLIGQVHGISQAQLDAASQEEDLDKCFHVALSFQSLPEGKKVDEIVERARAVFARHEAIRTRLLASHRSTRLALRESFIRCTTMTREAEQLARRGSYLKDYLGQWDAENFAKETQRLESRSRVLADREARTRLRAAVQTRRDHMNNHASIEILYERLLARLHLIEATLDSVESSLVRLSAYDKETSAEATFCLDEHLDAICEDVVCMELSVLELE